MFSYIFRARQKGYRIHCGRWLVEGNPQVILFDIGSAAHRSKSFSIRLTDSLDSDLSPESG